MSRFSEHERQEDWFKCIERPANISVEFLRKSCFDNDKAHMIERDA